MKTADLGRLEVQFSVVGSERTEQLDITALARIDREHLDSEIDNIASDYAFYSALKSIADSRVGKSKLDLEVLEAQLYEEKKKEIPTGQRVTDGLIGALIHLDPRWKTASEAVLSAKKTAAILASIESALDKKSNMLSSCAADRRAELAKMKG